MLKTAVTCVQTKSPPSIPSTCRLGASGSPSPDAAANTLGCHDQPLDPAETIIIIILPPWKTILPIITPYLTLFLVHTTNARPSDQHSHPAPLRLPTLTPVPAPHRASRVQLPQSTPKTLSPLIGPARESRQGDQGVTPFERGGRPHACVCEVEL